MSPLHRLIHRLAPELCRRMRQRPPRPLSPPPLPVPPRTSLPSVMSFGSSPHWEETLRDASLTPTQAVPRRELTLTRQHVPPPLLPTHAAAVPGQLRYPVPLVPLADDASRVTCATMYAPIAPATTATDAEHMLPDIFSKIVLAGPRDQVRGLLPLASAVPPVAPPPAFESVTQFYMDGNVTRCEETSEADLEFFWAENRWYSENP